MPFRLYNVTPDHFDQIEGWYPGRFQIEYNEDIADYVYESEKLCTLAGKKLHGKRNHINKFKSLYEGRWSYETMSGRQSGGVLPDGAEVEKPRTAVTTIRRRTPRCASR